MISILIIFLTSCQSSSSPPRGILAKVDQVLSSDTIEILQLKKTPLLHLIGVKSPPPTIGFQFKTELEKIILNKTVLIEFEAKLPESEVYLWLDQMLINEIIIKEGYALWDSNLGYNKYEHRLSAAFDYARIMEKGVWNPANLLHQQNNL